MMYLHTISISLLLQIVPIPNHLLNVRITIIEDSTGVIEVCLFREPQTFLRQGEFCDSQKVSGNEDIVFEFPEIASGPFAISVTHDVNSNGKFDLGFLKIPKEPYGFSNNPRTTFGPPSFEEAKIDLNEDTTIIIKL